VVLGIQNTGWDIHYVGLAAFLFGNIVFHWNASKDATFGNEYYNASVYISIFVVIGFIVLDRIASMESNPRELKGFSVSTEFFLSIMLCIMQCFLVHGLDQFDSIHLTFHKRIYK
jgi:hypothetical protein